MKYSPRIVNQSIKSLVSVPMAGVALYPETGDALEAALFGIDGVTTSLTIIKSGEQSDTSIAEDQLDALLIHHDVLFLHNAEVIMRHPALAAKIGERIVDSQKHQLLGLIFNPVLPGLPSYQWASPLLQNRFVHFEISDTIKVDG